MQKHVKLMVTAVFAALACSLGLSVGAEPAKPLGTKAVYIDAQFRFDPVTITKVMVGDQQIQPGMSTASRVDRPATPFQADDDWLKTMSIVLKNRTYKVIVRAEMEVWFLDTGNGVTPQGSIGPVVMMYQMTIGQRPDIDSFTSHGRKLAPEPNKKPLFFAPGQELVVPVADYVDEMQSVVEDQENHCCEKIPFVQVTRVAISRAQFYFVDGMRWDDLVGFGVPDPNHPGRFTNKEKGKYFPGDPQQNWPPPTQLVEAGRHTEGRTP